jgi:hypothetical protein
MQIYKTINLVNNKIYIGQDSHDNSEYLGSGKILKKAIKKYGKENFKKKILEDNIRSKKELNEREKYWISFYNSTDKDIGYNIAKGGDGGDTLSNHPNLKEIGEKISAKNSKTGHSRYIIYSQEIIDKIIIYYCDNKFSPAKIEKIIDIPSYSIIRVLKENNIKLRNIKEACKNTEYKKGSYPRYIDLSKNTINIIIKLYLIKKLSIPCISKKLKLSSYKVRAILLSNNISIRTNSESQRIRNGVNGMQGKHHTEESKQKMRLSKKENKDNNLAYKKYECPICKKLISKTNYSRHTNKCL